MRAVRIDSEQGGAVIPIEGEIWRPAPGHEGYEVSNHGRVRSLDRVIENPLPTGLIRRQRVRGKLLKQWHAKCGGYAKVSLGRVDGKSRQKYVHRIVMEAFIGPLPSGAQTRHLNGDPTDNRLANLAYGTQSENMQDMLGHGRHNYAHRTKYANGHEFSPSNTYIPPSKKQRVCRECMHKYRQGYEQRNTGRIA